MLIKGLQWSFLILTIMCAITLYGWITLPDDTQIAIHWNLAGEANGIAHKGQALLMIPAISIVIILIFALIPKIDPRSDNIKDSAAFYLVSWIGTLFLLAFAQATILYAALSGHPPSIKLLLVGVFILVILLGNFMAKSKSNWFAGLRTPWTLSSEAAWSVANRSAGWGFVITGISSLVVVAFGADRFAMLIFIAGLLTSILMGTTLSYLTWRKDHASQ